MSWKLMWWEVVSRKAARQVTVWSTHDMHYVFVEEKSVRSRIFTHFYNSNVCSICFCFPLSHFSSFYHPLWLKLHLISVILTHLDHTLDHTVAYWLTYAPPKKRRNQNSLYFYFKIQHRFLPVKQLVTWNYNTMYEPITTNNVMASNCQSAFNV